MWQLKKVPKLFFIHAFKEKASFKKLILRNWKACSLLFFPENNFFLRVDEPAKRMFLRFFINLFFIIEDKIFKKKSKRNFEIFFHSNKNFQKCCIWMKPLNLWQLTMFMKVHNLNSINKIQKEKKANTNTKGSCVWKSKKSVLKIFLEPDFQKVSSYVKKNLTSRQTKKKRMFLFEKLKRWKTRFER